MQRLLVRADDLGSFSGVTPAVLHARRHGIVRNASIMVPTPWFATTAEQLRDRDDLCLGLHLTICCEWPTARWRPVLSAHRVPCLVDDQGCLLNNPGEIHARGIDAEAILAECSAQLARARAAGLDIRYADTHMGWEWIHAEGGPRLSELMPAWCRRHGIRWHAHAPLTRLRPGEGASLAVRLLRGLEHSGPGTFLVVTHPLWASATAASAEIGRDREPGSVQRERIDDAAFLADSDLAQELARRRVELIRYDAVTPLPR